jgi:hypothetical protein
MRLFEPHTDRVESAPPALAFADATTAGSQQRVLIAVAQFEDAARTRDWNTTAPAAPSRRRNRRYLARIGCPVARIRQQIEPSWAGAMLRESILANRDIFRRAKSLILLWHCEVCARVQIPSHLQLPSRTLRRSKITNLVPNFVPSVPEFVPQREIIWCRSIANRGIREMYSRPLCHKGCANLEW